MYTHTSTHTHTKYTHTHTSLACSTHCHDTRCWRHPWSSPTSRTRAWAKALGVKYGERPTQTTTMRLHYRWKGCRIIECGVPPCQHNNPKRQQVVVSRGDETGVSARNRAQMTGLAGVAGTPDDQGNKHNS